MMGLATFFGSVVSNYAEDKLELTGLGNLLALSRRPGLNELACVQFAGEFGRNHVFTLSNQEEGEHGKHRVSGERLGRVLYGGKRSLDELLTNLNRGDEIKTTELTPEFDFGDYQEQHKDNVPLFAIDTDGLVRFPVTDGAFELTDGWTVTAIVPRAQQQRS